MVMIDPDATTYRYDWCENFIGVIFILILHVALLAISCYCFVFVVFFHIIFTFFKH